MGIKMEAKYFKNQLRGYNIVVAMLQAESEDDLCKACIGFDGAMTKAKKGLKKLKLDLQGVTAPEAEKGSLVGQIEQFAQQLERLPQAEDPTCMKTAGLCKIGSDCFPLDAAMAMMKQITTSR